MSNSFENSKNQETVNLKQLYINTKVEDVFSEIETQLIGLRDIKIRLKEIFYVLLIDKIKKQKNNSFLNLSLHMVFTGKSGTGKFFVAKKTALILKKLGYLTKGHILKVSRTDLIGQYVGHTAPKTKEILQQAFGGILYLDQVHELYKPDNEKDYGSEAVEILLQVMENHRDNLVLIFSGDKTKLEPFFKCNPGISSRIGNYIDFKNYSADELKEILIFLLETQKRYKITFGALLKFLDYINFFSKLKSFANVRTLNLLLQKAIAKQSIRLEKELVTSGFLAYNSLITITEEDFNALTPTDIISICGQV
jgi:probable Rubsico expression protein CbbX|uniref:Rubisco expression protein n=1 Tax=Poterioochromonas malhamensis TaxID=88167 RepID=A0A7T6Y7M1_9STRA|nr:rubisco expression protein [Poterioochromonas malhamensis]QQK55033.1 rubisco expression protein [Poterioochromonas malhamensis]